MWLVVDFLPVLGWPRPLLSFLEGRVVSYEYIRRGLHSLVDWEVFALMWANYDGRPWVYTGQFPFVGNV